jgi:hypothetical protein
MESRPLLLHAAAVCATDGGRKASATSGAHLGGVAALGATQNFLPRRKLSCLLRDGIKATCVCVRRAAAVGLLARVSVEETGTMQGGEWEETTRTRLWDAAIRSETRTRVRTGAISSRDAIKVMC